MATTPHTHRRKQEKKNSAGKRETEREQECWASPCFIFSLMCGPDTLQSVSHSHRITAIRLVVVVGCGRAGWQTRGVAGRHRLETTADRPTSAAGSFVLDPSWRTNNQLAHPSTRPCRDVDVRMLSTDWWPASSLKIDRSLIAPERKARPKENARGQVLSLSCHNSPSSVDDMSWQAPPPYMGA